MVSLSKKLYPIIMDIFLTNSAFVGALLLRFDGKVPEQYILAYTRYGLFLSLLAVLVFAFFNLYSNLWQYTSIYELGNIFIAVTSFSFLNWIFYLLVPESLPRSVFIIIWGLMLFFVGGIRVVHRAVSSWLPLRRRKAIKNILIIGAGQAGSMVIKELFNHPELGRPVAILDEDIDKGGRSIHGIPVAGTMENLDRVISKYNVQEIILAIPSAPAEDTRRILNQCKETGCKLKRLPGIYMIIDGRISVQQIRDVNISDLLGREEVILDMDGICSYLTDHVVFVTGAGGSIGSELCRQIANFKPRLLVMLDNYENNLYELQLELARNFPGQECRALIGSVQDEKRIDSLMGEYKPQVVFHAAAHKHVPLMEDSPTEAVKNNIFGTINVAKAADRHKVKKFILISTDKAVNPTNVMGASKRIAEIAVQQINKNSDTEYAAVRFGNVLGSNGSVIPIFQKQIAQGGPVTVTDPEVTRYFMTIPEAAQLVIQAGALAQGGEVFILDMGEPVKILDLAKDLIVLSGYKPEVDIKIDFIGLRPGEKMHEELLLGMETADRTSHDKIFICRGSSLVSKRELQALQKLLPLPQDSFSKLTDEIATTTDLGTSY